MATGYRYDFPLIDKDLYDNSNDKELNLYKQVFPARLSHWSLALIGLVQPNGGIFPLFEMQARWYALLMAGKCDFPSHDQIIADISLANRKKEQIFYDSPRNVLGVERIAYMDEIASIIGVKPDLQNILFSDFMLLKKLIFGPSLAYEYRLIGPHSWSGARDALMQSDYRVKYALNPNEAKTGNCFRLSANFYRIFVTIIMFLFVYFVFDEIFD